MSCRSAALCPLSCHPRVLSVWMRSVVSNLPKSTFLDIVKILLCVDLLFSLPMVRCSRVECTHHVQYNVCYGMLCPLSPAVLWLVWL